MLLKFANVFVNQKLKGSPYKYIPISTSGQIIHILWEIGFYLALNIFSKKVGLLTVVIAPGSLAKFSLVWKKQSRGLRIRLLVKRCQGSDCRWDWAVRASLDWNS